MPLLLPELFFEIVWVTSITRDVKTEFGAFRIHSFRLLPLRLSFLDTQKGSITVNGVSLTVVNSQKTGFSVAIIPYTKTHTTFQSLKVGDRINLEFDVIGKYVARLTQL